VLSRIVTVSVMKPEEHSLVLTLIIEGLRDRWGAYDPAKNPDRDAFPSHFPDAVIVVARQDDCPVGVGILRPSSAGEVEIVRMSVGRDLRRMGIGARILNELLAIARRDGIISTLSSNCEA
jgi:GNAT superfamily N-acetyltransferase